MANHKSAEKRARQTIKRNELNRSRRSAIRGAVKNAETAATAGDPEKALKASRTAESALARGASRGTMHWKTAARKTSRLAKQAKKAKKS
jgi:small subunit ribosomal protein S20